MPLKPLSRSLAEPGGAQAHHLHDTGLELTSGTRRRPHQQQAAVICSASQASCSDGLVRRHQREVSPLSRRVISPEGSTLIRPITGWQSLPPSSSTRNPVGVPYGLLSLSREGYGLTTFHGCIKDGLELCLFAGGSDSDGRGRRNPCTWPRTFWFKPLSAFGLLVLTTFISSSPGLAMPSTPGPRPPWR